MRAVHAACETGEIHGQISLVVTSSYTAGGDEWAMDRDVPVLLYPGGKDLAESERISPSELNEFLKNEKNRRGLISRVSATDPTGTVPNVRE